jgi:transportin-1
MEVNGHRPFDVVLPKVVNLLSSSNDKVRIDALTICNQFIEPPTPPNGLALCDDAFLAQIFKLASDSNTEIRKLICQSFNALLAAWAPKLWPNLKSIIDFMLYSTQDDDEGVALQAAEFWLTFLEEPDLPEHLKPYMDSVMPVLLKGMIYTDFAQAVLDQDNEDESKPDKDSDIKPKHYGSKAHTAERVGNANGDVKENSKTGLTTSVAGQEEEDDEDDDEDDDDDDEDDPYAEWTVRKCCAAALDMMATTFEVDILPIILPYLQKELESSEWKEREAGILALGAIAEGKLFDWS